MEDYEKDLLLYYNILYQKQVQDGLKKPIERKIHSKYPIIILTCMDHNINPSLVFQLRPNDIIILRNAGYFITEDIIRSILTAISSQKIKEIIIMGHINCQTTQLDPMKLIRSLPSKLLRQIGSKGVNMTQEIIKYFHIFVDEFRNIRNQMRKLQTLEILPPEIKIKGFIHDDESEWIFDIEGEKLKAIESIEEFKHKLPDLIEDKIQKMNKIFKKDKQEETNITEEPLNPKEEEKSYQLRTEGENINPNVIEAKDEFIEKLAIESPFSRDILRISIPKIRVPNIHIPKINISVPRKKSEMKKSES